MATPMQAEALSSPLPSMFEMDLGDIDWDLPSPARNLMMSRMSAPQQFEPPAPRRKVKPNWEPWGFKAAPTRLDLGLSTPLDMPELLEVCQSMACDDIPAITRCGFVYQMRRPKDGVMYQAFAAHLHQRGRIFSAMSDVVERVVKRKDCIFLHDPLENDSMIKCIADTWDKFNRDYKSVEDTVHYTSQDIFDLVVYELVHNLFQFFDPLIVEGFDEWRTYQLGVLTGRKKRKGIFPDSEAFSPSK